MTQIQLHFSSLFAVLFLVSPLTHAAEFRTGDYDTGYQVIVAEDEVIEDDLYVFGANVIIRGKITGDLITSCRELEILGTGIVEGNVLAAGQKVTISGKVNSSARIVAHQLILSEECRIAEDLVAELNNSRLKKKKVRVTVL